MRAVHASIEINVTPERALDAFGGVYTLAWGITDAGFKYISSGTIGSYEPGSHLDIINLVYLNAEKPPLGPMSLSVGVKSSPNGTFLDLTQDGYQSGETWDWYYEAVKTAWPAVLVELKKYLEGTSKEPA